MDPETIDQTLRHRTSARNAEEEPQQAQAQQSMPEPEPDADDEQTCRICLTGQDPDLGNTFAFYLSVCES